MVHVNGVPKTYDDAVRTLAHWHTDSLGGSVSVFLCPDPAEEVVQLIEVSGEFPATGNTRPFAFGRSQEFPFRSAVIQVTPGEWEEIRKGRLPLPTGWDLQRLAPVQLNG